MMNKKIRIVIIDDSLAFRELLLLMLSSYNHLEVVGTAEDGRKGMRLVLDKRPDVILLDIEMPQMDGFSFLRWMIVNAPTPTLVLSGREDAHNVFKALELGACDFLSKFRFHEAWFRHSKEFMAKINGAASITREKLKLSAHSTQVSQKRHYRQTGGILAIGASTGGPRALHEVIPPLPQNFPVPIVIAQHMPKGFTLSFSETLNKKSLLPVVEAKNGEALENGQVYITPGGFHLRFKREGKAVYTELVESHARDLYVPSIDQMICSAADVFGAQVLGVLLTGMGYDGKIGFQKIKETGGITFAESDETAVIYGMPRVAIEAKIVDKILPLYKMADAILEHYADHKEDLFQKKGERERERVHGA